MYILSEYAVFVVSVFVGASVLFLALAAALVLMESIQDLIEACRKIANNVFQSAAQLFRLALSWIKCAGTRVLLLPRESLSPCWPKSAGR